MIDIDFPCPAGCCFWKADRNLFWVFERNCSQPVIVLHWERPYKYDTNHGVFCGYKTNRVNSMTPILLNMLLSSRGSLNLSSFALWLVFSRPHSQPGHAAENILIWKGY